MMLHRQEAHYARPCKCAELLPPHLTKPYQPNNKTKENREHFADQTTCRNLITLLLGSG